MTGVVLFAGGGLACHGLKEAGIDLQLGVEWEADAVTVAQATGLEHVIEGDVRDPELRQRVERPGLLWSSFPCQAWSTAGKRQGAKDERNGWPWTVDAIDAMQPRWFLGENVRGLTFHRAKAKCGRGKTPKPQDCPRCYLDHVIMPQLRERFAWADYQVLDSADFGTPQHRRRVFIAAGPRPIEWPTPTHSKDGDMFTRRWTSMGSALGLTGYNLASHPKQERPVDVSEEPCPSLSGRGNAVLRATSAVMQRSRSGTGNGTNDERRSLDEPCVNLSGSAGGSTRPMLEFRAIGGGRNPQSSELADKRNFRDLTDEPCVTLAASQVGNRGPWIEERNSGVRGWTRRDPSNPSNTLLTGVSPKKTGAPDVPYLASEDGKGVGPRRDGDAPGTSRRRLSVRECRILMNAPAIYDEALALVTKTAAYRILGNGVDRQLSRLLALAVLAADQEAQCDTAA
jgi:site-specific DNA-cytosine methylase